MRKLRSWLRKLRTSRYLWVLGRPVFTRHVSLENKTRCTPSAMLGTLPTTSIRSPARAIWSDSRAPTSGTTCCAPFWREARASPAGATTVAGIRSATNVRIGPSRLAHPPCRRQQPSRILRHRFRHPACTPSKPMNKSLSAWATLKPGIRGRRTMSAMRWWIDSRPHQGSPGRKYPKPGSLAVRHRFERCVWSRSGWR